MADLSDERAAFDAWWSGWWKCHQVSQAPPSPWDIWQACAALASRPAGDAWQPIETAPKDGRRVLVAIEGVDRAVVAQWSGAVWETLDGHNWQGRKVLAWQPLPAAPDAARTGAG